MPKNEEYAQEACLGKVMTSKGKHPVCYLIKWKNWNRLQDITCEPPDNVLVDRLESPVLDQKSPDFQDELMGLLDAYLEARGLTPCQRRGMKRGATDAEGRSGSKSPKPAAENPFKAPPPTSVPADTGAVEVVVEGTCYKVMHHRQYVLLPPVDRATPLVSCFMMVKAAARNPGLVWSNPTALAIPGGPPGTDRLYGSVDSASDEGGVGWFHHKLSGVSIEGVRVAPADVPRFGEGDAVGLVIETPTATAFLVKNGQTVGTVRFGAAPTDPAVMRFALHLCPGDEVEVLPPPTDLASVLPSDAPGAAPPTLFVL